MTQSQISNKRKGTQSLCHVWKKNSKLYLQWRKDSKLYFHKKNIWLNVITVKERTQSCISIVERRLRVNLVFGERTQSCISSKKRTYSWIFTEKKYDSKSFYREMTHSHISIWRKDSKSYLQLSLQLVCEKELKIVSPHFTFMSLQLVYEKELKVLLSPHFTFLQFTFLSLQLVYEKELKVISSHFTFLYFNSCVRKNSKLNLHTLLLCISIMFITLSSLKKSQGCDLHKKNDEKWFFIPHEINVSIFTYLLLQ